MYEVDPYRELFETWQQVSPAVTKFVTRRNSEINAFDWIPYKVHMY